MEAQITTLSAGILLFLVMDPLGNIPLFLSLLEPVRPERRLRVVVRELLIALGVLFGFLFGGEHLLRLLQVRQEALSMAGGIVLFIIGLRMIFPTGRGIFGPADGGEPFIVPLAIPAVAGPSTMATVMLLANSHPGHSAQWSIALSGAWLATALILLSATWLFRLLGASVLHALERLMGMLLVTLSVQMILDGAVAYMQLSGMPGG